MTGGWRRAAVSIVELGSLPADAGVSRCLGPARRVAATRDESGQAACGQDRADLCDVSGVLIETDGSLNLLSTTPSASCGEPPGTAAAVARQPTCPGQSI